MTTYVLSCIQLGRRIPERRASGTNIERVLARTA